MSNYNPQDPYGYMAFLQQQQAQYQQPQYNQHYNQNYNQQNNAQQYQPQNITQQQPQKVFRNCFVGSFDEAKSQIVPPNEVWLFLCPNENKIFNKYTETNGKVKLETYNLETEQSEQNKTPDTFQMFNYIANQIDTLKGMLNYDTEPEPTEQPKPKPKSNKTTIPTNTESSTTNVER